MFEIIRGYCSTTRVWRQFFRERRDERGEIRGLALVRRLLLNLTSFCELIVFLRLTFLETRGNVGPKSIVICPFMLLAQSTNKNTIIR